MTQRPVRVRIAPSPTGDPHVGTAYMGLFNLVFARSQGGQFVLRIEDTDQTRSRQSSEVAIFEALRWLGLQWDEGPDVGGPHAPYRQSERTAIYRKYCDELIASGKAYRCFCTPERLAELREKQRKEKASRQGYDRKCRNLDPAESEARAAAGEPFVVRLAMPIEGKTVVNDRLRGAVEFDNAQSDDQVLLKSDGFPTYHLANVVDDHLMEITHVIRGEEWMSSTPKHVVLYEAFGWQQPEWIHMPLLRDESGKKLSKRRNPVSIDYYRDAGILPEALRNFLGIIGWSFGDDREKFTLDEMIEAFDIDRVSKGGPVFGQDKLAWMNEQYIHELSDEALADRLLAWRFSREHLVKIAPLIRQRIKRLDDFIGKTDFFFSGDLDYTPVVEKMKLPDTANKDVRKALLELVERYEAVEGFDAEGLEAVSRAFADENELKTGKLFMLLRFAVTGSKASPPLFETMAVLGKDLVRHRMRQAAELIGKRK